MPGHRTRTLPGQGIAGSGSTLAGDIKTSGGFYEDRKVPARSDRNDEFLDCFSENRILMDKITKAFSLPALAKLDAKIDLRNIACRCRPECFFDIHNHQTANL